MSSEESKRNIALLALFAASLSGGICQAHAMGQVSTPARPGRKDSLPVIVTLAARANLSAFGNPDKQTRRAQIVSALRATASRSQRSLLAMLKANGATDIRPLWIVNAIAASVTPELAGSLARSPGVLTVKPDSTIRAPVTIPATASDPEWNITAIHAQEVWKAGIDGTGVVVANMDTGVDYNHTDLTSKWRGGSDSWWDPYTSSALPYDAIGHGTQTMGLIVGGNAGGTSIGVAPGARWIAAKIYDDAGNSTVSTIHQAFEWLLNPSGVLGQPDAPDVVNASWGVSSVDVCDETFADDFEALRDSGIVIAFAAGNFGPVSHTSVSPANNVHGFSLGAVDQAATIAYFSSRGPSPCNGGTFPDLVAPGVNLKTSDISFGGVPQYAYVSGTSFAVCHVSGVAALLLAANPTQDVEDVEGILRQTAGDLGPAGPDDDYGYGLVDARAAHQAQNVPPGFLGPPVVGGDLPTSLPAATVGGWYEHAVGASGGVLPYAWSVSTGDLPPGLSLVASSGFIAGTPKTEGHFEFAIQLTDAEGAAASQRFSIEVSSASLRVRTASLPKAWMGEAYKFICRAGGGVAPYAWSIADGKLPPGLALSASTGKIAGTPTVPGSYDFAVQVEDASGMKARWPLGIAVFGR